MWFPFTWFLAYVRISEGILRLWGNFTLAESLVQCHQSHYIEVVRGGILMEQKI